MMKWWGWGEVDKAFRDDERPDLWPWVQSKLGVTVPRRTPPVPRESIRLPPPVRNETFLRCLEELLPADCLAADEDERLLHSFGKSYPDLLRVRRGEVSRAPDLVVLPRHHEDVERVVGAASRHGVRVIPFGGGTNIVGGVNPDPGDAGMVVSLDLRRMDRLLALDELSQTATLQCGALGPHLESQLNERGWSLGHHPDSFVHSTLGGWLATRSAGMQSDAYGKIEDMVVALRLVTPAGTIATKALPRAATGPDVNQLAVGSEGVLGVITEATMRVHPDPPVKAYHAFLFPTFDDGARAMHACVVAGHRPSLFRLSDEEETGLSFHMKPRSAGTTRLLHAVMKRWLARRGYATPALMIVGFEGTPWHVRTRRRKAVGILRGHRGFHLGTGPARSWSAQKYDLPYLRDWVMDRGIMVDVAETSTRWTDVVPLHRAVCEGMAERFRRDGIQGYLGCHVSHTYATGACLYFTWAVRTEPGRELEQYRAYKGLLTDLFVGRGAALSHHHAIGTEHLRWMRREHSPAALEALNSVKARLDPGGIMNPGKLLPPADG